MSTYWGYTCHTCQQDSECYLNHGEDKLRAMARHRTEIESLKKLDEEVDIGLNFNYYDPLAGWLYAHQGHEIALKNEYGDEEPIDPKPQSLAMKVSIEILSHFSCQHCKNWWSIADFVPAIGKTFICPLCENRNVVESIVNGAGEQVKGITWVQ